MSIHIHLHEHVKFHPITCRIALDLLSSPRLLQGVGVWPDRHMDQWGEGGGGGREGGREGGRRGGREGREGGRRGGRDRLTCFANWLHGNANILSPLDSA